MSWQLYLPRLSPERMRERIRGAGRSRKRINFWSILDPAREMMKVVLCYPKRSLEDPANSKKKREEGREKETSLNTGPILDPAELSRQLLLYIQEMPAQEEEFVRFHRIVSRLSRLLSKSYGKT